MHTKDLKSLSSQPSYSSSTAIFDLFVRLHHDAISNWVRCHLGFASLRSCATITFTVHTTSGILHFKTIVTELLDRSILSLWMFQVEDIITRIALKGWEERLAVLSWALRTYPGPQMMADPSLGNPAAGRQRLDEPEIMDSNQIKLL